MVNVRIYRGKKKKKGRTNSYAITDSVPSHPEKFRKMLHREKEGTRLFLKRNGKKGNSELHAVTTKIIQRRVDNLNPLSCMP